MADTPTEGGTETPPVPRRTRKPRSTNGDAAKTPTSRAKPAESGAAAKSSRTGASGGRKRASTSAAAKPAAAKPAARSTRKAAPAKSRKPAANKNASPAARVAKSVQDGVAAVTPSGRNKKFAAVAALAGVAAGIATVFGRRKISQAASDAIDAVSGTDSSASSASDQK